MDLRSSAPRVVAGLALLVLGCLIAALYVPYLDNPLIFDDRAFFRGYRFADYATSPFALEPRRFAHFTIAATQVLWGSLEAHRSVSLALHAARMHRHLLEGCETCRQTGYRGPLRAEPQLAQIERLGSLKRFLSPQVAELGWKPRHRRALCDGPGARVRSGRSSATASRARRPPS